MATEAFFDEQTERSAKKTAIVAEYFQPWTTLVCGAARKRGQALQYFDLCAGPGQFEDGSPSTPILILQKAVEIPKLHGVLKTRFNDENRQHSRKLEAAIRAIQGIQHLHHEPLVDNYRVDEKYTNFLEQQLSGQRLVPTLSFIDPFGYSALSLRLIHLLTRDWGCDCIFFFNYNRVNPALTNPTVDARMDALFGRKRADELRQRVAGKLSVEREVMILQGLKAAIEVDDRRMCRFTFKNDSGARTSHHLVLVTKSDKGITIMKQIMAKQSSWTPHGLPSFEHNPARQRQERQPRQLGIFHEPPLDPLVELCHALATYFAGRTLSVEQVYEEYDRVDERFLPSHCKDALLELEDAGAIKTDPPAARRQVRLGKVTLAKHVRVSFPHGDGAHE